MIEGVEGVIVIFGYFALGVFDVAVEAESGLDGVYLDATYEIGVVL